MSPDRLALLAALLVAAALAIVALTVSVAAAPILVITRPDVSATNSSSGGLTLYKLSLTLPPLTSLRGERVACVQGAKVLRVQATAGASAVREGCVYLTVENPGLRPLRVEVLVEAEESREPGPPILVALVAAAASAAAASYLTMTEGGREKLFSALSIPASYYILRREDASRSPKRVAILKYVRENPGVTARRISRETGISFGEVQWHLSILERLGLVERVRIGKYSCYYPSGTPLEVWLSNFIARELGTEVDAETLRRARPRLEPLLERGAIPYQEVKSIITGRT